MRGNKKDESFNPTFRNTRSRLYQRKPSTEYQDYSQSKQPHPEHSGSHWKAQGNQAFKNQDYDKAIQCYSKAIVKVPRCRKLTQVRASITLIDPSAIKRRDTFRKALKMLRLPASLTKITLKRIIFAGAFWQSWAKRTIPSFQRQ
jgi:tetratricopeptide (TPR) repeat protein